MTTHLMAISVMFLWALCFPLISLGLDYAPPLLFAFLRALIAGLSLLLIAKLSGRPAIKGKRNWSAVVVIGFTATSIGFWGMFYAGGILAPGIATVLTNTQPFIALVLGWFVLKETLNSSSLLGFSLGFFGVILISADSIS